MLYLDNAATTEMYSSVKEAMIDAMDYYGNPSPKYSAGKSARNLVEKARGVCAASINAKPGEIYFTSGGTESDNWAIINGVKDGWTYGRSCIVTSRVEHKAILNAVERSGSYGVSVRYVEVGKDGTIDIDTLEAYLASEPISLVSIMMVNNEIGTIQPIKEIARLCHKYGALCHTDAVQAYGKIEVDVKDLDVDMLSVSAHKIHGSKGIGFLYCKEGVPLNPLIVGGGQERGMRSGTENTIAIVGFGAAAKVITPFNPDCAYKRDYNCRYALKLLAERIPEFQNNVPGNTDYSAGIINFNVGNISGSGLVLLLDSEGIMISNGSACDSSSIKPSHVLTAIGVPEDLAINSFRVSFTGEESQSDIQFFVDKFAECYNRLKKIEVITNGNNG
ncbi:MAG: cysteine desulfurase family protein [Oscillospiraceae bacterium]